MADYYSILSKTISGLANNSGEIRGMVYNKARAAIEKQLRAMHPTPSDAAIAGQMKQLENAITKLEAENGVATDQRTPEPVVEQAAADPKPAGETEPQPTQEAVSQPVTETNTVPAAETTVAPEPVVAAEPLETVSATPAEEPDAPEGHVASGSDVVAATAGETVQEPAALEPEMPASEDTVSSPSVDGPSVTVENTPQAEQPAMPEAPPSVVELDPEPRPGDKRDIQQQRPAGSSGGGALFIGRLLPYVLVLLVLGGGAYALWLNKDALIQAFDNFSKQEEVVSVAEPVSENDSQESQTSTEQEAEVAVVEPEPEVVVVEPEAPADSDQGEVKEAVRLGENGEDVVADPVEPDTVSGQTEVPLVLDPAPETSEPAGEVEPVAEPNQSEENVATETAEIVTPAVGERAYLYEEGGTSEGAARSNASVVWSLGSESPQEGLLEEAVIIAQLEVPEKALSMNLKIKRNTDEALSASHIIELIFTSPEGFVGGSIDNVARFVMKATEQARGEGLIAVPVRIDAGFFLIALNNLQQAVDTNTNLLLQSGWIDIPLGYASGRRALVTFEKGDRGEQVFKDAFEDWKNR